MWALAYWFFPLFSAVVWLAMLLALLLTWVTQGKPHYPSMDANQKIAYISDVGAQGLKPLFIAMGAVTVVSFDVAFILERWLRHRGTLAKNTSLTQKILSWLSIITAIAGAAGLILLSIFDTLRHPKLHDGFLALFIAGYVLSAVFTCAQYQRLGVHFRQFRLLRISFWVKLAFIIVEVALAIAFGVCQNKNKFDTAAILEWVIALIFTFYVLSFFIDFIPAHHSKHHQSRETEEEMAFQSAEQGQPGGRYYNHPLGYTNGHTNDYSSGHNSAAATRPATDSYSNGYVGSGLDPLANGTHPNDTGIHGDTYYPDGHKEYSRPAAAHPPAANF